MNGTTFLGRDVRLDLAHEKGTNSKDSNSFQKGGRGQSQTIFVRGFDKSAGEDEVYYPTVVALKVNFMVLKFLGDVLMVCSIQIFTD